jgi:hypothetical protein
MYLALASAKSHNLVSILILEQQERSDGRSVGFGKIFTS